VDLPIGILLDRLDPETLPDQLAPEIPLDLLEPRLVKTGN
jgi:hypothetical protein